MEGIMGECDVIDEQSSFGIKKIVDCKIGDGGQQMYRVKWQATWEPAENLVSCQHLIDEFWSFVNNAKAREDVAQQHRKRMHLKQTINNVIHTDQDFNRLTDDTKAEVQRLIARTNATSAGSTMLKSPSDMLMPSPQGYQQNYLMAMAQTPTHGNNQNFPNSPCTTQDMKQHNPGMQMPTPVQKLLSFNSSENKGNAKSETVNLDVDRTSGTGETVTNSKISNQASLKYIENFSNPYVKVIIVCKICNKEASKFSRNWKPHYLTHVSSEEKPHRCTLCPAGFVSLTALRKHEEKKHPSSIKYCNKEFIKGEVF